ncbi:MAG: ATP-binding protein [Lewinellaceae bacterium]|nr:ATP-binding protein [Saprospiraceae bacterium]MCB9337844.1 ATP-binding protein [Lewinellaceae bacterium]
MRKIVLTGPESTGKTTLAKQLAGHFGAQWVPEYAREYLESLGRKYVQDDLIEIAKGQIAKEDFFAQGNSRFILCDTSLEVIQIWSKVVFGNCAPWITEQLKMRQPDLYLLCQPDLPWAPDPLRENPNDRDVLYTIYQQELAALGTDFIQINGIGNERFDKAAAEIEKFINQ